MAKDNDKNKAPLEGDGLECFRMTVQLQASDDPSTANLTAEQQTATELSMTAYWVEGMNTPPRMRAQRRFTPGVNFFEFQARVKALEAAMHKRLNAELTTDSDKE